MVPDDVAPEWSLAVGSRWCQRLGSHCVDLEFDQPLHSFLVVHLVLLVLGICNLITLLLLPLHLGIPLLRASGAVEL